MDGIFDLHTKFCQGSIWGKSCPTERDYPHKDNLAL